MTHIVIDSTVLDALIAAGESQHHVLGNVPCWCRFDAPYAPRSLVKECVRCTSRKDWSTSKAAADAAVRSA